jgi:hypothetical protein
MPESAYCLRNFLQHEVIQTCQGLARDFVDNLIECAPMQGAQRSRVFVEIPRKAMPSVDMSVPYRVDDCAAVQNPPAILLAAECWKRQYSVHYWDFGRRRSCGPERQTGAKFEDLEQFDVVFGPCDVEGLRPNTVDR